MRRSARAISAAALLLSTACAGGGLAFASSRRPVDATLLLSCAQNVAANDGLSDVRVTADRLEARSLSDPTRRAGADAASYDALTVALAPTQRGPQLIVGGATYALRELRSGGVGTSAGRAAWERVAPSERVALARDAILAQCGALGR